MHVQEREFDIQRDGPAVRWVDLRGVMVVAERDALVRISFEERIDGDIAILAVVAPEEPEDPRNVPGAGVFRWSVVEPLTAQEVVKALGG